MGAHGNVNGFVSLVEHLGKGDVFSHLDVIPDLRAHLFHDARFIFHDISRKPVVRDANGGHASGFSQSFKNGDGIPFEAEVVGAGETRRPRADDSHLLGMGRDVRCLRSLSHFEFIIRHKSLQPLDGDAFIQILPPAVILTGADADPS